MVAVRDDPGEIVPGRYAGTNEFRQFRKRDIPLAMRVARLPLIEECDAQRLPLARRPDRQRRCVNQPEYPAEVDDVVRAVRRRWGCIAGDDDLGCRDAAYDRCESLIQPFYRCQRLLPTGHRRECRHCLRIVCLQTREDRGWFSGSSHGMAFHLTTETRRTQRLETKRSS